MAYKNNHFICIMKQIKITLKTTKIKQPPDLNKIEAVKRLPS